MLSAGVKPSVAPFAEKLGIQANAIHAVELDFTDNGDYIDFNRASPLVDNAGKQIIIEDIKKRHPRLLQGRPAALEPALPGSLLSSLPGSTD